MVYRSWLALAPVPHMPQILSPFSVYTITRPTTSAVRICLVNLFEQNWIYLFVDQWFVVMSTQLIGFSIGGIARRFLVAPPSMIWPANLVNCALFNTLHSQQYAGMGNRGGLSRERFFVYVFVGGFFWCECIKFASVVYSTEAHWTFCKQTFSRVTSVSSNPYLRLPIPDSFG